MELPPPIQEQLDSLTEKAEFFFSEKQFKKCIELYLQCWELLPIPKEDYDESFHVAQGLIRQNMLIDNLSEAKRWAYILLNCDAKRIDSGERDMWFGKIAFEENKLDEARNYFKVAFKKSKGRRFLGADNEKYYKFYLDK